MQGYVPPPPSFFEQAQVVDPVQERLDFLRKVYRLLALTVLVAAAGAMFSLYAGASSSATMIRLSAGEVIAVPPLVAFFARHWIIGFVLLFGAVMGVRVVQHKPGINTAALLSTGFLSGLYVAPLVFVVQLRALDGTALTLHPVRDAFLLAVAAFSGLTGYVMVTKKDFSFLRGLLTTGFWVVLGAIVLSWIAGSSVLSLAGASAGVLLFSGFILYDTSRMLHDTEERLEPVPATINLFLNFLNLFLFLLRIFGGRR